MMPSALPIHRDAALLDQLARRLGLRLVVLFGSHATGKPAPGRYSDVDLAIALQPERPRPSFWEYYTELGKLYPDRPLDLVFLVDADPLFRWEILREGKLLWGDPVDHLEYRAFAYRDFVDSADLRALERRLFEKKMAYIREQLHAPS